MHQECRGQPPRDNCGVAHPAGNPENYSYTHISSTRSLILAPEPTLVKELHSKCSAGRWKGPFGGPTGQSYSRRLSTVITGRNRPSKVMHAWLSNMCLDQKVPEAGSVRATGSAIRGLDSTSLERTREPE